MILAKLKIIWVNSDPDKKFKSRPSGYLPAFKCTAANKTLQLSGNISTKVNCGTLLWLVETFHHKLVWQCSRKLKKQMVLALPYSQNFDHIASTLKVQKGGWNSNDVGTQLHVYILRQARNVLRYYLPRLSPPSLGAWLLSEIRDIFGPSL